MHKHTHTTVITTNEGMASIVNFQVNIYTAGDMPGGKGEVLPYSLPSVGPGDDLSVQAVSLQVTKPST